MFFPPHSGQRTTVFSIVLLSAQSECGPTLRINRTGSSGPSALRGLLEALGGGKIADPRGPAIDWPDGLDALRVVARWQLVCRRFATSQAQGSGLVVLVFVEQPGPR